MKARKNPTDEQLKRRLRRAPESDRDPRTKSDPYWALRFQGQPHHEAKRVFRNQRPIFHVRQVSWENCECDPEDMLLPDGFTFTEMEVAMRPLLSEESIRTLEPRESEYTVWDRSVTGFGVRVRTSGHSSFVVYYRSLCSGKLRKHTIGKVAEVSLEQAREAARAYRSAGRQSDEKAGY